METEQEKEIRKKEIKREAAMRAAAHYFEALDDKPLIHERRLRVVIKSKDGMDIEMHRSEYDIPYFIESAILSLNNLIEMNTDGINFNREELKSIEINFD